MSTEQRILASCIKSRDAYETLKMHCALGEFTPIAQHWIRQVEKYYDRDDQVSEADYRLLKDLGLKAADSRHAETLAGFYDELPMVGISPANVVADILTHKRNQLGLRLAARLVEPTQESSEMGEMIEEYEQLMAAADAGLNKLKVLDPSSVEKMYDPAQIVPLYPRQLRAQCMGGGAMPGHHILVFGRPEAGKSLFTINLAAGAAYAGKRVLYFGNEESVQTHYCRMACNLARMNISEFQENRDEIIKKANQRGLQNVTFIELAPGTFAEVEQGIVEYRPDLVVIDQLAGLDVGEANPVRAMDKAARGFRTLLLKHGCVGISVSQAGDRTERHGQLPPAFLGMGDVYGSRTGLPAQVDLMIGIGYDEEMYDRDVRGVSLPKNKLGGSHSGFKVRIDKQQSRVKGLA